MFFQAVRELSGTVDSPLTGRSAELSRLKAALEGGPRGQDARRRRSSGEAGAGKRACRRELLKDAGCDTLRSAALPRRRLALRPPYAPLASAWASSCRRRGVGRLLPGESRRPARRAQAAPLLLVLEDCHFADAGSWDLLAFLLGALQRTAFDDRLPLPSEAETGLPWSTVPGRQAIDLRPLGPLDRLTLIEALLGLNGLPARLKSGLAKLGRQCLLPDRARAQPARSPTPTAPSPTPGQRPGRGLGASTGCPPR